MPTGNFVDEALVIAGFTVDVNGNESPDGDAPIREDWVFGAEGLSKVAGLVFQMQGTLGVESNAAQPLYLNRPVTVGDVKAYVQAAPTGAAITFTIYVGGAAWLTLTIPAGQTAVVATPSQIGALIEIPADTAVSIGITAVGQRSPVRTSRSSSTRDSGLPAVISRRTPISEGEGLFRHNSARPPARVGRP